jgi:hypothetical protein
MQPASTPKRGTHLQQRRENERFRMEERKSTLLAGPVTPLWAVLFSIRRRRTVPEQIA